MTLLISETFPGTLALETQSPSFNSFVGRRPMAPELLTAKSWVEGKEGLQEERSTGDRRRERDSLLSQLHLCLSLSYGAPE